MGKIKYIISGGGNIILLIGDNFLTIHKEHPKYVEIIKTIKNQQWTKLKDLTDMNNSMKRYIQQNYGFSFEGAL